MRKIAKIIFLKWMGWSIKGQTPTVKKYLIVVAPHTSNWDFVIGVFARKILPNFNPRYFGKKELFIFPFGYFFRWLGGYPVERGKHTNFVDQVVAVYNKKDAFCTTITPEGTRSYNPNWKSGFYHIAKKANVPILRVGFDFPSRTIHLDQLYEITKDYDQTLREFKQYFSQFTGKNKEDGVRWPE